MMTPQWKHPMSWTYGGWDDWVNRSSGSGYPWARWRRAAQLRRAVHVRRGWLFFMGIFWDVWDSDHVFFLGVVSVGWKYVQNQLDLHRGLYVTFMGISMISLYRGISYIHATRNDPFMWFMCRDMYHHHGACGVAMLDKSSPQLLGSRHAHGWPSNQKKEHKKKHHTRAVKKHEEQTGNVSNIFHIIYVAHLLICLFSNSTIKNIPSMLQWQLLV